MFTIKAAAELTSVPVATLRAWERRYGIATPRRTEAGYRLYDDRAIGEVRLMASLVASGWAPRQAADEVLRRRPTGVAAFDALADMHVGLPGPEALVEAATTLDDAAIATVLDEVFSRAAFEHVLEAWLTPALHHIGDAWLQGRIDVAGEHFVSAAIMRRLASLYESTPTAPEAARIIVGLPQGGEHEIPALAFAIVARRAGLHASYIGANVPAASWAAASLAPSVAAIVMGVATGADAAAAGEAIRAVREVRPDACIVVGGKHASNVPDATFQLGDDLVAATQHLITRLRPSRS